jgi:hypothetical protein
LRRREEWVRKGHDRGQHKIGYSIKEWVLARDSDILSAV